MYEDSRTIQMTPPNEEYTIDILPFILIAYLSDQWLKWRPEYFVVSIR